MCLSLKNFVGGKSIFGIGKFHFSSSGILAIQAKLDRATTANGDTLDIPPHPLKQGFGLKQDPPNHFVDHNISLSLSA